MIFDAKYLLLITTSPTMPSWWSCTSVDSSLRKYLFFVKDVQPFPILYACETHKDRQKKIVRDTGERKLEVTLAASLMEVSEILFFFNGFN